MPSLRQSLLGTCRTTDGRLRPEKHGHATPGMQPTPGHGDAPAPIGRSWYLRTNHIRPGRAKRHVQDLPDVHDK